jgi:hypothetical protein
MGSSLNPYTLLVSQTTCATANQELNAIMFTHRQCMTYAGGSGFVQSSFSTNGGATWDSSLVIYNDATNPGRYPGGVFYNPTGNTTPANAYSVIAGPNLTSSASGFDGNFFASMSLGGQNRDIQKIQYADTTTGAMYQTFARLWMQSHGDKFFVMGNANTDDGTNYTSYKNIINNGVWNAGANKVDWTRVAHVPDFIDVLDGYRDPGLIMAPDGMTGYLVYIGRDATATDNLSYIPMIYKTTDGGATWVKQAAFDWNTIQVITDNVAGVGVERPMFGLVDAITMDANGRVHFGNFINVAASNHPDSLQYYLGFQNIQGFIYDIYQTASGWDASIVDTVWAKDVEDASSPWGTMGGWDCRLQAAKSADGSKIFYCWMDTDPNLGLAENLAPDIKVRGMDVATGTWSVTKNFTVGTAYEADNFYMYFANIATKNGTTYTVHPTTSQLGNVDTDPAIHYYLSGCTFDESEFTGINEAKQYADLNIFPNPNNGTFVVNVTTSSNANVNLKVYNTIGVVVYNEAINVNGFASKSIDLSNITDGMYIVEIESPMGKVARKIIKQN